MFLLSPQILMLAAAMALSATAGWRVTANHYQAKIARTELALIQEAEKAKELNHALSVAGLELSGAISERNAARHERMNKSWEIVYVDVIEYRDKVHKPAADGFCYLDGEWVRLHEAAADLSAPTAPSGTGEGATYAEAIEAVTANYREYGKCRAQVIGLQEFYEGLRRLHEH